MHILRLVKIDSIHSTYTRIYWVDPRWCKDIGLGEEAIGYLHIFRMGGEKGGHIRSVVGVDAGARGSGRRGLLQPMAAVSEPLVN